MNRILLGYQSGVSKKGNPFLRLIFAIPSSDKAIENGACGYWTKDEFADVALASQLKPEMIMKPVELSLGYSDFGFPQINGIKVVK